MLFLDVLLRLFLQLPQFRFIQSTYDCITQTQQIGLQHIICGATFQGFNRIFFTNGAGNKNEWGIRDKFLADGKSTSAVKGSGKGKI